MPGPGTGTRPGGWETLLYPTHVHSINNELSSFWIMCWIKSHGEAHSTTPPLQDKILHKLLQLPTYRGGFGMQITVFPCSVNLSHCNNPPRRLDCLASSVCERGLHSLAQSSFLVLAHRLTWSIRRFGRRYCFPFQARKASNLVDPLDKAIHTPSRTALPKGPIRVGAFSAWRRKQSWLPKRRHYLKKN